MFVPPSGTVRRRMRIASSSCLPSPTSSLDSLPTMDAPTTDRGMVTGQERLRFHYAAEAEIPSGIPVNVLLYPMEGDYNAAIAYWLLAYRTGGSFMSISKDWP